ncbi:MAG: DUF4416 family protein [Candidatus Omnitrophota bacterium]
MGRISSQRPAVKLIAGFIFKEETVFQKAKVIFEKHFGSIDFQSQPLNFTHTDYYRGEFGEGLYKKIVSFRKLVPPQKLPEIKILTNKAEKRLSFLNKRLVNIDPGYLDLSKLVLASTKDYAHRIYLNKGIYGEITLFYRNKTFAAWECTYPDYRTPQYLAIFNQIRQIYSAQLNAANVSFLSRPLS